MQKHRVFNFMKSFIIIPPFCIACRYVLKELIETEKYYVEDLGLIVEVKINQCVYRKHDYCCSPVWSGFLNYMQTISLPSYRAKCPIRVRSWLKIARNSKKV